MQNLLFLCTGNYYRSRFAELLFNSLAAELKLAWKADSRALALEMGANNVGPISRNTVRRLQELGIKVPDQRFPLALSEADLAAAAHIVAVKEAEHRPMFQERFSTWTDRVEFWHVHDMDFAPPEVALIELEAEVRRLVERLQSSPLSMPTPSSGDRRLTA